jgi:hypothetical protein
VNIPLSIDELRSRVSGAVLLPSDEAFADTVSAFNTTVRHSPDVAVVPSDTTDVSEAVRFAITHNLPVRVQSTGHGATGSIDGGVLLITRDLDSLSIDRASRIATIGAGVRWGAVIAAAAEFGLAPIAGASGNVGVVGLLTGGGFGPLIRSHGVASDYLRGLTVVTGTGDAVEATAEQNPDLFWALRGGKAGLGIVTEVRIELVELATLYAGSLFFEEQHIEQALRGWTEWTASAPDDVSTSVAIFRFPPFDFIPAPFRGRTLLSLRFAYPGSTAEGERLAAPLRGLAPLYLDALGELPVSQVATIHNDPSDPSPVWDRGVLLNDIDQDFLGELLHHLGSGVEAPFLVAELRHLGSGARRDVPEGSAVGGRSAGFTFVLIGAPNPALFETVLPAAADRLHDAIGPWISPETNVNIAGKLRDSAHFASAWPADTFERLAAVRKRYDPQGVFPHGPVAAER